MNKRKTMLSYAIAAGTLVAMLSVGALAQSVLPQDSTIGIPPEPGKTVVGVQVSRAAPENLAFEVPLYVTMAAVDGPALLCPQNYSIRNHTTAPDGSTANIAVTGLTVRKAPDSTWTLTGTPTSGRELAFSVGKVPLPALSGSDWESVNIRVANSAFYSTATNKYLSIPNDSRGLLLALEGVLPTGWTAEGGKHAVPQFRLRYTVSLLDKSGNPIGVIYDGPGKQEAQEIASSTPTTP